jgi:hypothetical protein
LPLNPAENIPEGEPTCDHDKAESCDHVVTDLRARCMAEGSSRRLRESELRAGLAA